MTNRRFAFRQVFGSGRGARFTSICLGGSKDPEGSPSTNNKTQQTAVMGLALVLGCGLVAFGPSLMLWVVVVGKRPALVIIGLIG